MPPSSQHEARHRIFQKHKDLIAECLSSILGVQMQEPSEISVLSIDLTETRPLERRADTVLQVRFPAGSNRRDFIPIDIDTANYLADFLEDGLGDTAAQRKWKALMATVTHPYVSEHKRKAQAEGRAEGRAQGQAAFILRVLDQRGIEVDDASRQRIESCTDTEVLTSWLDRSLNAKQVSELFG